MNTSSNTNAADTIRGITETEIRHITVYLFCNLGVYVLAIVETGRQSFKIISMKAFTHSPISYAVVFGGIVVVKQLIAQSVHFIA